MGGSFRLRRAFYCPARLGQDHASFARAQGVWRKV
ncbi:hypothetical protein TRL7639_02422 [Falsiruegeria litorea R37]|uniref:Uncharacterized protein n=1 Tax=Falsiruegeria litorea R37 TaxID=1200284 RepID=A0A1Y5SNW6_9RHOB|nr:hypothetical protein TRL7639_02422 [Falsiruegeria litorea R37]